MTRDLPRPLASFADHTLPRLDATRHEALRVVAEAAERRAAHRPAGDRGPAAWTTNGMTIRGSSELGMLEPEHRGPVPHAP